MRVGVGRSALDEVANKAIMSLLIGAIVLLDLCAYDDLISSRVCVAVECVVMFAASKFVL